MLAVQSLALDQLLGNPAQFGPAAGENAFGTHVQFVRAGVDVAAVAEELQREGAEAFGKSWNDLMNCLRSKSEQLRKAG